MALGVPVVGSDSGEIPWVIGDAGLVFPEGNSTILRERLRTLFHDEALSRELAARGRARVASYFTNDVLAEQTHAIYGEVTGVGRRAS
jgi:glycosyltransferase involved in cell wall biosynthesis